MAELAAMKAEIESGMALSAETRESLLGSMLTLSGATGLSDLRAAIRHVLMAECGRIVGTPAAGL